MPQKVRPSNVDKKVEVMFRARNVFTDVAIKVRSNGEELASFKREPVSYTHLDVYKRQVTNRSRL